MKILIYGINYAPELTGIGKFNGDMANWLVTQGHEVRVISAPPYYPEWQIHPGYRSYFYKKEKLNNVEVIRCPLWIPFAPSTPKRLLHLLTYALSSFPVILSNVFWRPDVIITIEPPVFCLPGSLLAAFFSRAKTVLHIQDFEIDAAFELALIHSYFPRKIVVGIESFFMRRFTRVSSISPNMVARAVEKGISRNDVMLFPNWVDTKEIYPLENGSSFCSEFNIEGGKVIALYSGNMGEKQGLEIIIEVARQLTEKSKIQFVMCGTGAAYTRLRKLADGLSNILWIPLQPLERLNDLLNLADIHLLPQSENVADLVMPSKLTGMLASGRPVVATALPGTLLADVVQGCGIVTEPGAEMQFRKAIEELANSPEKRAQFGLAARRYAVRFIDRDAVMSNFESDLIKVISN